MHKKLHNAILSTLCYSDVFDFPLTQREAWEYLISKNIQYPISNDKFQITLKYLLKKKKIQNVGEYYCLPKRMEIIAIRMEREEISAKKIEKAKWVAHLLSCIPTVQLVAISGSVAMLNAPEAADIDLFLISSCNTLWITRFIIFLILSLLGIKRSKAGMHTKDTICANMFMEEKFLCLPDSFHNLYTAHEFVQLKILINKHQTKEKLFAANNWIKEYLPNAFRNHKFQVTNSKPILPVGLLQPFEHMFRKVQLWYMKSRQTREITEEHLIAFHPTEYNAKILKAYKSKIQIYGI